MASKKQNSYNFPEPIDNEQLIGHKSVYRLLMMMGKS